MSYDPVFDVNFNRKVIPITEQHWHLGRTLVAPLRPLVVPKEVATSDSFSMDFTKRAFYKGVEEANTKIELDPYIMVKRISFRVPSDVPTDESFFKEEAKADLQPYIMVHTVLGITELPEIKEEDPVTATLEPYIKVEQVVFLVHTDSKEVASATPSFSLV